MKRANPLVHGVILTEPEFPYEKKRREPEEPVHQIPPPPNPPQPPGPPFPPETGPKKFICPNCKKVFNTQEELTVHMETVHQSPKKKL
jgi:hypothetical protein